MHRIPMPKASLLLVAVGGALLLGQQVAGADAPTTPTLVLTVPAADVTAVAAGHSFVADMRVDDAASATMR